MPRMRKYKLKGDRLARRNQRERIVAAWRESFDDDERARFTDVGDELVFNVKELNPRAQFSVAQATEALSAIAFLIMEKGL